MCPYALAHHPRARTFGAPTNGAFGETRPSWSPDPFLEDFIGKATIGQALDKDGNHLQAMVQKPDEEVWLNREDAPNSIRLQGLLCPDGSSSERRRHVPCDNEKGRDAL